MPTPPPKTPLPPSAVDFLRRLDEEYAAGGAAPPPPAPRDIPLPTQPDLVTARAELAKAMREGVARQLGPGTPEADATVPNMGAYQLLRPVQTVPPTPSLSESLLRAVLPQRVVDDQRPLPPDALTPSAETVRPVDTTEQRVAAAKQAVKRAAAEALTLPVKPFELLSSWALGTPSDAAATALAGPSDSMPLSRVAGGLGRAILDAGGRAALPGHKPTAGEFLGALATPAGAALVGVEQAALGPDEYRRRYADQVRDADTPDVAAENTALWGLRLFGTAVPAAVQEGALRLPVGVDVPDVKRAARDAMTVFGAMARGEKEATLPALAETAANVVAATPFTFGEFIGAPAGHNVRVRRDGEAARYFEGVLERIERGEGLEVDVARAAANRLGPEYEDAGWWAGLVVDALTGWERAVTEPAALGARLGRNAGAIRTLTGADWMPSLRQAALTPTVDVAEQVARRWVADLEQGRAVVEDMPPALREKLGPYLEAAAQQHGMTFEELALTDGLSRSGVREGVEDFNARVASPERAAAEATAESRALAARADELAQDARSRELAVERELALNPAREARVKQAQADVVAASDALADARYLASPTLTARDLNLVREGKDLSGDAALVRRLSTLDPELPAQLAKAEPATKLELMEKLLVKARGRARAAEGRKADLHLAAQPGSSTAPAAGPGPRRAKNLDTGADLAASIDRQVAELGRRRDILAREGARVVKVETPAAPGQPRVEGDPVLRAAVRLREEGPTGPRPRVPTAADYDAPALAAAQRARVAERQARAVRAEGPVVAPTPDARGLALRAEATAETMRTREKAASVYALRNKGGDVVAAGNWNEVVDAAQRRRVAGDEVWRGAERPVARWQTAPEGFRLGAYGPLAGDEATLVAQALPVRQLRRFRDPASRAWSSAIADLVTDAPALGRRGLPTTDTGRAVEDAVRMYVRDRLGADELVALPNGALVTPGDRARMVPAVQRQLEAAGVAPGLKPDPARVKELARRWGVPLDEVRTAADVRALRDAGLSAEGRMLASTRSLVRGAPSFARQLYEAAATLHTGQTVRGKLRKLLHDTRWGGLTWAFLDDPMVKLTPEVRQVWREAQSQLERLGDDLMAELKTEFTVERAKLPTLRERMFGVLDPAPALSRAMRREAGAWVPRSDVERATLPPGPMSLDDLNARLAAVENDPRLPRWATLSDDPAVRRAGLDAWSSSVLSQRDAVARRYLRSTLESAGLDVKGTTLGEVVAATPAAELAAVYDEVILGGDIRAPSLQRFMRRVAPGATPDPAGAAVAFIANTRAEGVVADTVARLTYAGVVLPAAVREARTEGVLDDMLNGNHRTWSDGRWVYHHPPAAVAWAERTLRAMGLEPGTGPALKRMALGDTQVYVPTYLADQLDALIKAGRVKPENVTNFYKKANTLWKTNALQGLVVPNMAFHVGQMLSLTPQLWTTRGLGGAAGAGGAVLFNGRRVGEMMQRLSGPSAFRGAPASPFDGALVTRGGNVFSMDDLEGVLRRNGLADSQAAVETSAEVQSLLDRETSFMGRLGAPLAQLNDWNRQAAGATDMAGRLAVFFDDVLNDVPVEQAARNAKAALLDYRALTGFESRWLRQVFTFYAYMRKTSDAFLTAMFEHPERIGQQARAWHAYQTFGLTPEEKGQLRDEDIGRVFLPRWPIREATYKPSPAYKGLRVQSTPVGPSENINVLRTLASPFIVPFGFVGADVSEDGDRLMESVMPTIAIPLALAQGVLPTGRGYDTPTSNVIPPGLMDNPLTRGLLIDLVAAGPVEVTPDDWHRGRYPSPSATAANSGRPAYWAAGGALEVKGESLRQKAARSTWQAIRASLSRAPDTYQGLARATGALEPTPFTTQDQEALAWLLGMRLVPDPTAAEATRRGKAEAERKMRDATRELSP